VIRINLAKAPGKPGRPPKAGKPVKAASVPRVRKAGGGAAAFVVLLVLAAGGGGAYYYITYVKPTAAAAVAEKQIAKSLPPPVPKEPTAPKPSSQVRSNMVEDVVKEFGNNETVASNRLATPYPQMPLAEKINYEALFMRNVMDMITRCTPPDIRLRALEITDFQEVTASGAGAKAMVEEMFTAFKHERGELMPKPSSYIKDGEGGKYAFAIVYKPNFGLQVSDPFQALEHLTFKEGLPNTLKKFSRLAGDNNFKMSAAPSQLSVEKAGDYRRVTCKAVGMSTYGDIHRLVRVLYNEKVPCAFKKISMMPVRDEQVRVTAEVLFTVKE
jgi:hypothetical protein